MGDEQIVLRVTADGFVSAETIGVKGPRCLDTIAILEDLLEAQTVSSEFTPEYLELGIDSDIHDEVNDDLRQF